MKNLNIILFTICLLFASFTSPVYAVNPPMPGIYSLDKVINQPYVTGVVKRMFWDKMEPTEGNYDFSELDTVVTEAAAAGKYVTIANILGTEPAWLMAKIPAADLFMSAAGGQAIVVWNDRAYAAMQKLAKAQASHVVGGYALKDHPYVKHVNTPFPTENDIRYAGGITAFDPGKYWSGIQRAVQVWYNAYPNKVKYIGLIGVNDGTRDAAATKTKPATVSTQTTIVNNLRSTFPDLNVYAETATGQVPGSTSPLNLVKDQVAVMIQSCGSWTGRLGYWAKCNWVKDASGVNIDTPEMGFNYIMANFNTTYYEVYNDDLNNAAYTDMFKAADLAFKALSAKLYP